MTRLIGDGTFDGIDKTKVGANAIFVFMERYWN